VDGRVKPGHDDGESAVWTLPVIARSKATKQSSASPVIARSVSSEAIQRFACREPVLDCFAPLAMTRVNPDAIAMSNKKGGAFAPPFHFQ
jgi:hypothetical protein